MQNNFNIVLKYTKFILVFLIVKNTQNKIFKNNFKFTYFEPFQNNFLFDSQYG